MVRPGLLALTLLVTPALAEAKGRSGTTVTVARGDTLWGIARKTGCSVDALRRANDLAAGAPLRMGARLKVPKCGGTKKGGRLHVVRGGDTLSAIAVKYGTTVEAIQSANNLPDTVIHPGQSLAVGAAIADQPVRVVEGQSVGRPQRGELVDGVRLPYDAGYYRRRLERAYGAQHVVDHVRRAVASVRGKYPKVHRLAVGDLSDKDGGRISGHSSHQSGRDVDLGLYFSKVPDGYPRDFVRARDGDLHRGATWALVHSLYLASKKDGGPEKIFLDYKVQGMLYEHARGQGVSKAKLAKIFQYPDGRWAKDRLVKHEPLHADHIHVRFACPNGDTGCH